MSNHENMISNLLDDLSPTKRAILVVGPSGSMKTISASLAPSPQLWIASDPGPHSGLAPVWEGLKQTKENYVILSRKVAYQQMLNFVLANGHKYKTIIFDSITFLQPNLLDEIMSLTKKARPTFDEWGLLQDRTRNLIKAALSCESHVWINCLESFSKDEVTGQILGEPHVFGKLAHDLSGMVRTVLHIESRPRMKAQPDRIAYSVPTPLWRFSKDSEGLLLPEEPHPEWVSKMFSEVPVVTTEPESELP